MPSVREIPLEENPAVFDFAEQLLAGQIDLVIFMTGVGTRFLFEVVETRFPRERFLAALQRCQVVVRGPKPTTFLREWQVRIDHRAQEPNTWRELLEVVDSEAPVAGRTVAIQEYGEPNEEFYQELQRRGARILPVPVYRWALPEDSSPLRQALESTIAGEFDVLLFTSAIQFKNVLQVAGSANRGVEWIAAANRCVVASIGPTASENAQLSRPARRHRGVAPEDGPTGAGRLPRCATDSDDEDLGQPAVWPLACVARSAASDNSAGARWGL